MELNEPNLTPPNNGGPRGNGDDMHLQRPGMVKKAFFIFSKFFWLD